MSENQEYGFTCPCMKGDTESMMGETAYVEVAHQHPTGDERVEANTGVKGYCIFCRKPVVAQLLKEQDNEIVKSPVMYLLSVRRKMIDVDSTYIETVPVVFETCDYPDSTTISGEDLTIRNGDVVLGTIPVPLGTMEVRAVINNSFELLGYEYPGAPAKDWKEILKQARQMRR